LHNKTITITGRGLDTLGHPSHLSPFLAYLHYLQSS
jgi:hypothetical protein